MQRLSRLLAPLNAAKNSKKSLKLTSDLLQDAGYVKQSSSGVFTLLPLGQMVQRRVEAIIRRRMDEIGGTEISLPTLATREIWAKSGRLENGQGEHFHVEGGRYVLAPTCEEEITQLVASKVVSPRELPLRLYQINKKFRNELRPRGGLLRGREFTMKDMYTFDVDREGAQKTYRQVREAYGKIFEDIGVPAVVAEADSGNIGGSLSHEYHFVADAGEDSVFNCGGCGYTANIEKAVSCGEPLQSGTAEARYFISKDHTELVGVFYPSGRRCNPVLVNDVVEIDQTCTNPVEVFEQADPLHRRMVRILDVRVGDKYDLPEPPTESITKSSTTTLHEPIVEPVDGEQCIECSETLTSKCAIEVAHTFYLGTKYSEPFNCKVNGQTVEMGCYGIGVSRIVAAVADATRDVEGLKWPRSIAPFEAVVVSTNPDVAEEIVTRLGHVGISAVWDDRSSQFGALLGASRSLGFPLTVIAGKKYESSGVLEVQQRSRDVKDAVFVPSDRLHEILHLELENP